MMRLQEQLSAYPNITINDFSKDVGTIRNGIIFLYGDWSGHARAQLYGFLKSLEKFPSLPVWLFDIDHEEAFSYINRNGILSHGYGETYWIKNGRIIHSIVRHELEIITKMIRYHGILTSGAIPH